MIIYKNLVILGTSHISIESIKEVRSYLSKNNPTLIALELDKNRYHALLDKSKKASSFQVLKEFGLLPFVLNMIGHKIEKELGKIVGVVPGSEMVEAIKISKEKNIPIALIDQDIRITLKKLSKTVTFKEKTRFILDILTSFFPSKNKIKIDLSKVPEKDLLLSLITKVKDRYPSFYKVLVEDRNKILAKNLYNIASNSKEVFVVVGAGHLEGLLEELKKMRY